MVFFGRGILFRFFSFLDFCLKVMITGRELPEGEDMNTMKLNFVLPLSLSEDEIRLLLAVKLADKAVICLSLNKPFYLYDII